MRAVALARLGRLALQVERLLRAAAEQHLDGLFLVAVHHVHRAGGVKVAADRIKLLEQRTALGDPLLGQPRRQAERRRLGELSSVNADIRVDG